MTVVRIDMRKPAANGVDVPAAGYWKFKPTRILVNADNVTLPDPFTSHLVAGVATVTFRPTGTDWCWQGDPQGLKGAKRRYFSVIDTATVLDFYELPEVDPTTLDPTTPLTPVWRALVDELIAVETNARVADVNAEESARIAADLLKAPLASPALTGNPTAPTPTAGDNDTSIATTAFATDAIAAQSVVDDGKYAPTTAGALGVHSGRVADIRRAKGGIIGTGGKAVVAWRVDHLLDEFRATTWPILRDRGMPCGLGVVTKAIPPSTLDIEPTTTTWDQLRTCHWEGVEIWGHSATHKDPLPYGATGGLSAYNEIVQPRIDLEAQNLRVMGFQMPGVSGVLDPNYSANFATVEQIASGNGQMLVANYALLEIDRGSEGTHRALPTNGCFMLGHLTIDSSSLATAKANVDAAVKYGWGIEIMHHPKYIGLPGYMTLVDFTALVDYVAVKRDAGLLEVLTPSGLAFADPSSTNRLNLLTQSSFEGVAFVGNALGDWTTNNVATMSLRTDGGHEGANYVRFTPGANYLYQPNTYITRLGVQGAAFMVEAWVRAGAAGATAGAGTVRFYLMDNSGGTPLFIRDVKITVPAGGAWTKVRVPFCIPKTCPNLLIRVSRWGDANTGDIDVDEVKILAV